MAIEEFKLPDVGEGVAEGELVSWLVAPGDTVTEDQPVAEVETDKALVEVPSPYDGTVKELLAEEGDVVPVGDVIITFDVADEAGEAEPAGTEVEADEAPTAEADSTTGTATDDAAETPSGRVFAPPSARRLARELGVDVTQVDGSGPAGRITDADVRAAAEAESEDESAGPRQVDLGGSDAVAKRTGDGETATPEPESAPEPAAADRDGTLAAPATRRLADELDVNLDDVPATEERDGEPFVTPEAVEAYADAQQTAQAADAAAVSGGDAEPTPEPRPEPTESTAEATTDAAAEPGAVAGERVPYRGVRRAIGEQMERSKYTAPHVTHHDDVDVTALVKLREELKPVAETRGVTLSYMPFVAKAVTAALEEFPMMNAMLDEENEEIVLRDEYNLGVATATDAGLMVPVVDDVDTKGLLDIARDMNEKVQKARDRDIAIEEMRGGTFTLTNVGVIGGEYATPIINYPEVGILALGAIKARPRVVDGEVVPRQTLPLSLSIDHRVIDGAVAARFTNTVKEYLENPKLLLLE